MHLDLKETGPLVVAAPPSVGGMFTEVRYEDGAKLPDN